MITQFHYDSDINAGSLMVRESRVVAGLLLDMVTKEQWEEAVCVENMLQKRSLAFAKKNAMAIRKRLEKLEPEFLEALRDGDNELATQVAFCGVLARNLLLVEFIETVLRDAYKSRAEKLETFMWTDFLVERAHRDSAIGDLKESTTKKMGQVVFRMLAEVGYLKSTRKLELQHVVVRPEVKNMLDVHQKQRIKQCMEVSTWTR